MSIRNNRLRWLVAAVGVYYAMLAFLLCPPETLWSGDAGLKLIQVESLLRSRFSTLALEYPGADLDPDGEHWPYPLPFAAERDGRYYSTFPPYFPALTAPFYWALGYHGLRVLPFLGGLAVLLASIPLSRRLGVGPWGQTAALVILALASPLAFYSATFWEHTLATALCMASLALVSRGLPVETAERPNGPHSGPYDQGPPVVGGSPDPSTSSGLDVVSAGLCAGAAFALRHEALVFIAAMLLGVLFVPLRATPRIRAAVLFVVGAAIPLVVVYGLNLYWFGHPLGLFAEHFVPDENVTDLAGRIGRQLGIAREMLLDRQNGLLLLFPVVALGLIPSLLPRRFGPVPRLLSIVGAVYVAAMLAVAPNAGGKQFGPRYLLLGIPPLLLAAASVVSWDDSDGREREAARGRRSPVWPWPRWIAVALLIVLGLFSIVRGFQGLGLFPGSMNKLGLISIVQGIEGAARLRVEKNQYDAPMLQLVADSPADVVLSSHPFFPQQAASLYFRKKFLLLGQRNLDVLLKIAEQGNMEILYVDHPALPPTQSFVLNRPGGGALRVEVGPSTEVAHYRLQTWKLNSTE